MLYALGQNVPSWLVPFCFLSVIYWIVFNIGRRIFQVMDYEKLITYIIKKSKVPPISFFYRDKFCQEKLSPLLYSKFLISSKRRFRYRILRQLFSRQKIMIPLQLAQKFRNLVSSNATTELFQLVQLK